MTNQICTIIGIGPGNGAAFARAFSERGYRVALLSRNLTYLNELASELKDPITLGCDVTDPAQIRDAFAELKKNAGPSDIVIYNAGEGQFANVEDATEADFELAWRINTLGLVTACKQVIPDMKSRGAGSIVVIGATASIRGGADFAPFASAKAAQRSLSQSMARHLGPSGVHVSYVIIDGVIGDAVWAGENMPDTPTDHFLAANDIAESVYFLTQQSRSAWTFELDLRPFGESW